MLTEQETIRLDNVYLWRRTQEEFSYDLKKTILSFFEGKFRKPNKQLILRDINLSIYSGEKIGIIGSNGSGKSTLLKLICGILKPTKGQIRVRGNIAPLIELGAGFDEELSVVDNIIMYGVMLGFPIKKIKARIKEILDFAELETYALHPIKALSSGMKARLAFALTTDVEPDILILDEVLSVGDENFRHKSLKRMESFLNRSITVLMVSHNMDLIEKYCDKVIWIQNGEIKLMNTSDNVIKDYLASASQ
jgi:ABC-type polysaccharide/polyol phosphate transport system ATPase subunit